MLLVWLRARIPATLLWLIRGVLYLSHVAKARSNARNAWWSPSSLSHWMPRENLFQAIV